MKIIASLIVCAFTLCLTINADTPHVISNGQEKDGKCPNIKPLLNFTIDKFMGTWYGYASSKLLSFEPLWKCTRIEITKTGNKTFKLQDNNFVRDTGNKLIAEFNNTISDHDQSSFDSVLTHVSLDGKPFPFGESSVETGHILAFETDFLVLYKCGNTKGKNTHKDGAFIMARHRPLSAEKVKQNAQKAVDILHKNGIYDSEPLIEMIQDKCDKSY